MCACACKLYIMRRTDEAATKHLPGEPKPNYGSFCDHDRNRSNKNAASNQRHNDDDSTTPRHTNYRSTTTGAISCCNTSAETTSQLGRNCNMNSLVGRKVASGELETGNGSRRGRTNENNNNNSEQNSLLFRAAKRVPGLGIMLALCASLFLGSAGMLVKLTQSVHGIQIAVLR